MKAVVYGGAGQLGRAIVSHFKTKSWNTISIDYIPNPDASHNIILTKQQPTQQLSKTLTDQLHVLLTPQQKLDAIVNVAGGWMGGHLASDSFLESVDTMFGQSVVSSAVSCHLAASFLKE
jgi:dihydropteridine reductase